MIYFQAEDAQSNGNGTRKVAKSRHDYDKGGDVDEENGDDEGDEEDEDMEDEEDEEERRRRRKKERRGEGKFDRFLRETPWWLRPTNGTLQFALSR